MKDWTGTPEEAMYAGRKLVTEHGNSDITWLIIGIWAGAVVIAVFGIWVIETLAVIQSVKP